MFVSILSIIKSEVMAAKGYVCQVKLLQEAFTSTRKGHRYI